MKKLIGLFLAQLFVLAAAAHAAQPTMDCEGATEFEDQLKLVVFDNQSAKIVITRPDGKLELEQHFAKVDQVWDGHMTGLITARGLSVKYDSMYGFIRNVVVTTNVRAGLALINSVSIPVCKRIPD